MENETKKIKTYGTKSQLLEGIMKNRGKNFMIISEILDRDTKEVVDTEHKVVYEKYVDSDIQYIIDNYNDDLVYYPKGNKNIIIVMKEVKPNVDDDIFTVKTAKGSTKRQPISMN
jgi:hypothetical protein